MKSANFPQKSRILVTGATGFVGSNILRELVKENFEVHIITRGASNLWRIKDLMKKVENHTVDLMDVHKLKRVINKIRPDIIFHLAGLGLYGGKSADAEKLFKANLFATVNLLQSFDHHNYQCFVNTGSSSEYGPKAHPMKESDVCTPSNLYAVTKLSSTLYASFYAKSQNKPIITLRLFSPFGPYDDKRRLIPYAIAQSLRGRKLELADKNSVRDFIFIEDVVQAFFHSVRYASKYKGEVINIGSGLQKSVDYVVAKILKYTHSKSRVVWNVLPPRPQESPVWRANITRAKKILNWKPENSFDEGVKKTINWFKKNNPYTT